MEFIYTFEGTLRVEAATREDADTLANRACRKRFLGVGGLGSVVTDELTLKSVQWEGEEQEEEL